VTASAAGSASRRERWGGVGGWGGGRFGGWLRRRRERWRRRRGRVDAQRWACKAALLLAVLRARATRPSDGGVLHAKWKQLVVSGGEVGVGGEGRGGGGAFSAAGSAGGVSSGGGGEGAWMGEALKVEVADGEGAVLLCF
jgi:hypothetical protein